MQYRGMEIRHVAAVFDGLKSNLIGQAHRLSALDARAGESHPVQ